MKRKLEEHSKRENIKRRRVQENGNVFTAKAINAINPQMVSIQTRENRLLEEIIAAIRTSRESTSLGPLLSVIKMRKNNRFVGNVQ